MDKYQLIEHLENLMTKGGLEALLPQNLSAESLHELCKVREKVVEEPHSDKVDVFESIGFWFLYGKKLRLILPSVMQVKVQTLMLALFAEKCRREGNPNLKHWPLPNVDNLFDDKDVNFYFYKSYQTKFITTKESNPLRIIDDPYLNKFHKLPNLVDDFASDLNSYYNVCKEKKGFVTLDELIKIIVYLAIDNLIEYSETGDKILPLSIIEDTKNQIISAAQGLFEEFHQQTEIDKISSQIDMKIYEDNIVAETQKYLQRLRGDY